MKDDFYIGYLEKAPRSYSRRMKWVIAFLVLAVASAAIILVINQKGFSSAKFEYGSYTKLSGKVFKEPVPMIKVPDGKDHSGKQVFKTVLLVGYGKQGAKGILEEIETREGISFEKDFVTLQGTLLYGDGKTLLEIPNVGEAFAGKSDRRFSDAVQNPERFGKATLEGEIIDPKCYFGVMKPGEGKPHRSCAIRCISGGIPPVFAVKNEQGESNYFLLLGKEGEPVNKLVLDFVAEPVTIEGELEKYDDWMAIRINTTPLSIFR